MKLKKILFQNFNNKSIRKLDNFLDVSIIKIIPRNNKILQIITKFNKINKN